METKQSLHKEENKLNVAIYCRVSTELQTLEQQLIILEPYAKSRGWTYQVFIDKISGAKTSRKGFDEMMNEFEKDSFNGLLILRLDRLGRSLIHILGILEKLQNMKIEFYCLYPSVDTSTSYGRAMLQMSGVFAELERSLMADRMKEKLKQLKSEGTILGSCNYGFCRKNKKTVMFDEKYREAINKVFVLYQRGNTLGEIMRETKINKTTIRSILRNKIYVESGIIDKALWDYATQEVTKC